MPFDNYSLSSKKKSFTGFKCPECAKDLSWKKLGQWGGGVFGFLRCPSHRFPTVWGIPIFLRHEHQESVSLLLSLVERKKFQESLEIALAGSVSRRTGRFLQKREWARRISPSQKASFEVALSPLSKGARGFFRGRLNDASFQEVRTLARGMVKAKRGPILDLGCGIATLAYAFAAATQKMKIVSLDANFHFLYCGRRFFRADSLYVCADAGERLPFSSRSFGGIVCFNDWGRIRDREGVFRECWRLLKPSGFLCWQP